MPWSVDHDLKQRFLNGWVTDSLWVGRGVSVFLQNFNNFCRKNLNSSFWFEMGKAESSVLMSQSQMEKGALRERQEQCLKRPLTHSIVHFIVMFKFSTVHFIHYTVQCTIKFPHILQIVVYRWCVLLFLQYTTIHCKVNDQKEDWTFHLTLHVSHYSPLQMVLV